MKGFTLLEVSYEVANKVGGIYTVLVSKIAQAMAASGEYYAIGPYHEPAAASEFSGAKPPEKLAKIFSEIKKKHGFSCFYGNWKIAGNPKTVLVDFRPLMHRANEIKRMLWEEHGVDSWGSDDWFNEPVVWSKCVGILIEEMERGGFLKGRTVAHFHEWLSGAGLLHLKTRGSKVKTVFTTHSTVLGRTIAESGLEDLYGMIKSGLRKNETVRDEKAYQYHAQAKHMLEKATALRADVFTTVSETVAEECQFILGRKPEPILNNGLDMKRFPSQKEVLQMHGRCSRKIKNFMMGYFLPYYDIDPEKSMIIFISGRHEFRNKGIDIFISSLGKLNSQLKTAGAKNPLFAIIWVPYSTSGRKPTVAGHLEAFNAARGVLHEGWELENDIIRHYIRGQMDKIPESVDKTELERLRGIGQSLLKLEKGAPPFSPFNVSDNNITQALVTAGLLNREEDIVKVIYYPAYVSEKDGLLNMKYYDAMAGCDIGVFPSYYESWGYTPLEAAALGLQAITTDLSGFGRFIKPTLKDGERSIMVLSRDNRPDSETSSELYGLLLDIYRMSDEEKQAGKTRAKELSKLADWNILYSNYLKAYGMALRPKE